MIATQYIPLLTIGAALLVPFLTEYLKSRFGAGEAGRKEGHELHREIMAELTQARVDRKNAEEREADWQDKYQEIARREIALIRELAGKDLLLTQLSQNLPELTGRAMIGRATGTAQKET
ncbi:MAG: hypothetical protein ACRYFS_10370 [Janthinobacterium lividum]